ncbi:dethiobiotin synthase [Marinoscillum sp. MHG1-6]|uniref:dethiobiotin synthase n=1 Tax=Marinoscillum sp. MHG1-6 TaxID=2959627 RepID=UPI0021584F7A|nr:dethiobiotin synthase [Marinoscillum sp. MHG1-6]
MNYFVTAIDTDSGKTLVSAIITEMLGTGYWKPVQAGYPTDTEAVKNLVTRGSVTYYPERYLLQMPASPHAAAKAEGVDIHLEDFVVPEGSSDLVIEGAGGALVPLNDEDNVIDLAGQLDLEVVVVSNLYLGSINHTLLTAEAIKSRNLRVKGVIFNGAPNPESERVILLRTGWKKLLHIERETQVTKEVVQSYAKKLKANWS